jgi:predicted Rossmann-fold nucleotide-binding protein
MGGGIPVNALAPMVSATFAALLMLSGCQTVPRASPSLTFECPTSEKTPNARYVGPYLGVENHLAASDRARDIYCADLFKSTHYSNGFVTIFGSSRISDQSATGDAVLDAANKKLYEQVLGFARGWTQRYGTRYPILTGAGPGLMEGGNRGAHEAGGPSIGYTTYYDPDPNGRADHFYRNDPSTALHRYKNQDIITDGLIFTSISMRETAMIEHSAAIVIAPGGTGTEWEIFQILETVKSHQLATVPIYIVGDRETYWKSLDARLADMVKRGTLSAGAVTQYVEYVDDAQQVVEKLRVRLALD